MKTTGSRWLTALCATVALAAVTRDAGAFFDQHRLSVNYNGTICRSWHTNEVSLIDPYQSGIMSLKDGDTKVICPLVVVNGTVGDQRLTRGVLGFFTVAVDVTHYGTQTTSCSANIYGRGGDLFGSGSASKKGSGTQRLEILVPGIDKDNHETTMLDNDTTVGVLCTIAGNSKTRLHSVMMY